MWEMVAETEEVRLNLELKTFTFCALLNVKRGSACCTVSLSRAFRPFFSHASDFSEGKEESGAAGLDWSEPF